MSNKIEITPELLKELSGFIIEANLHGYAAGDESTGNRANWVKEPDGSESIVYERGPWKLHDNFFGGVPYGGREVVFYEGQAVWIMVYYGSVPPRFDKKRIYSFLQEALRQPTEDLIPVRGPARYTSGSLLYTFTLLGSKNKLADYHGVERITDSSVVGDPLAYEAEVVGGWVDIR